MSSTPVRRSDVDLKILEGIMTGFLAGKKWIRDSNFYVDRDQLFTYVGFPTIELSVALDRKEMDGKDTAELADLLRSRLTEALEEMLIKIKALTIELHTMKLTEGADHAT